jgi:hypothetical protein
MSKCAKIVYDLFRQPDAGAKTISLERRNRVGDADRTKDSAAHSAGGGAPQRAERAESPSECHTPTEYKHDDPTRVVPQIAQVNW